MPLVAKKGTTLHIYGNFLDLDLMRVDSQGTRLKLCKICSCVIRAKDRQTTNLHDHLRVRHAEVNRNDDKQNITEHRAGL